MYSSSSSVVIVVGTAAIVILMLMYFAKINLSLITLLGFFVIIRLCSECFFTLFINSCLNEFQLVEHSR